MRVLHALFGMPTDQNSRGPKTNGKQVGEARAHMWRSSKWVTLARFIFVGVLMTVWPGCERTAIPSPTAMPTMVTSSLTNIVKDIVADPKAMEGRPVTLVGYYRGWDLMGDVGAGPPVTRSDWVIRDGSGAIYVQAGLAIEGGVQLRPDSRADMTHVLRVTGVVRVTGKGRPFIEPQRIELVPQ